MVAMLPLEILQTVSRQYPCRDAQIEYLAALYTGIFPSPSTLVLHGLDETHKLDVILTVLCARNLKSAAVRCKECLGGRHLLVRIFGACLLALGREAEAEEYDRIDGVNALLGGLEKLFKRVEGTEMQKVVLVLDGVDRARCVGGLLPALAGLGDLIPGLSVIFTSSSSRPLNLHKAGVPYIYFPPYTRAEAVYLITQQDPPSPDDLEVRVDDIKRVYTQFAVTVYDALVSATASTSISTFRNLCEKMWPRFIWPAVSEQMPGTAGKTKTSSKTRPPTWDFAKLLIRNRSLFQGDAEGLLVERLEPKEGAWTFEELQKASEQQQQQPKATTSASIFKSESKQAPTQLTSVPSLLKPFPTTLLLASYLASHTPPKNDIILFSRLSSTTKRIRKRKSHKHIFASPGSRTPTKPNPRTHSGGGDGTPSKSPAQTVAAATSMTKNMLGRTRTLFDAQFGAPKAFSLERVLAVLRAVHPEGFGKKGVADRVYREMGELERMRLVERAGDEDGGRWRVSVGRAVVEEMGKGIGVGVGEWEVVETRDL